MGSGFLGGAGEATDRVVGFDWRHLDHGEGDIRDIYSYISRIRLFEYHDDL